MRQMTVSFFLITNLIVKQSQEEEENLKPLLPQHFHDNDFPISNKIHNTFLDRNIALVKPLQMLRHINGSAQEG